jgi:uncharacterized protein YceH (UPF0502 family)
MPLSPVEIRILGSLMEKEATTPDNYPLSLNALTAACNQLSNREPVMELSEIDVRNAVNALRQQSLVRAIQPAGSKVMKFQHLLTEKLNLDARERALLCVLFLRGAQTLGELRARTGRMAGFATLDDVQATLAELGKRNLAVELPRRPGQKETRFAQLMGGTPAEPPSETIDTHADASHMADAAHTEQIAHAVSTTGAAPAQLDRIAALEALVDDLRGELGELRAQFEDFRRQFS